MILVINTTYNIIIAPATTNPISSPITENMKSVVFGYKNPNCVWFPFNNPIPVSPPAPIANLDCIILYPAPLGSDSGFKNMSILFLACSGNTKLYNNGNAIVMLIGLIFLILAPIFGQLMQLAISRKREFLADATAIEFTRNPDGLISALEKISADPNELKVANKATENMYIANPFRNKKKSSDLWSTHPSTEARIEALRNLK